MIALTDPDADLQSEHGALPGEQPFIEATIGTDDGAIDLGRQRNTVRDAR